MPEYDSDKVKSGLSFLYEEASRLDSWHKEHAEEFIRVGEYSLALDSIAYAYLLNDKPMPSDQLDVFNRLAVAMDLENDPEYDGVARLRASASGRPA